MAPTLDRANPIRTAEFKELIKSSGINWPGVTLLLGCLGLWVIHFIYTIQHHTPLWVAIPLATLLNYIIYTALHEATHGTLVANRFWNHVLGWFAVFPFMAPYSAFRYIHLEHHRYTNRPHQDPDHWSLRRPLLPHWFTQSYYYYFFILKRWSKLPFKMKLEMSINLFLIFLVIVYLVSHELGWAAFFLWFLPGKLAIGTLAFAFNWLPHYDHESDSSNQYKASSVRENSLLTLPLFFQNYHLIHHLYPSIPFFKYQKAYQMLKPMLLKKGAIIHAPSRQMRLAKSS